MTSQDRADLEALKAQRGYSVLMGIIEDICKTSEDHLVWINPEKDGPKAVIAAQAIARAQRLFAVALANKISFEIKEWKDELEAKRLGLD